MRNCGLPPYGAIRPPRREPWPIRSRSSANTDSALRRTGRRLAASDRRILACVSVAIAATAAIRPASRYFRFGGKSGRIFRPVSRKPFGSEMRSRHNPNCATGLPRAFPENSLVRRRLVEYARLCQLPSLSSLAIRINPSQRISCYERSRLPSSIGVVHAEACVEVPLGGCRISRQPGCGGSPRLLPSPQQLLSGPLVLQLRRPGLRRLRKQLRQNRLRRLRLRQRRLRPLRRPAPAVPRSSPAIAR